MAAEHVVRKMERRPTPETFECCPTCGKRPIIQHCHTYGNLERWTYWGHCALDCPRALAVEIAVCNTRAAPYVNHEVMALEMLADAWNATLAKVWDEENA